MFHYLCVQDPQYMQQALTNALLMDAVVGSLQNSKAIYAASKLAHFERIKMEGRGGWKTCCIGFLYQLDHHWPHPFCQPRRQLAFFINGSLAAQTQLT